MWKTNMIVVLLFGVGQESLIFCCVLLKCYYWYEVLWLLVEFKVGKDLVVEKCGVLNYITTRFNFHVIFVFPLRCNCFHSHLWFFLIFFVLFVFMLWNTNVVTNKLWVKSHCRGVQKCYHIILFSTSVHVWTSTIVILEHFFPFFFHNMVDYNTKKSITKKKSFFQFIMCDFKVYLWQKNVRQCAIIDSIWLE